MKNSSDIREIKFTRNFIPSADGSVLVEFENTRLICTVTINQGVPKFLDSTKDSWLTAEYAMLPASTPRRKQRERDRVDARSLEIQRLIGRSLRQAIDLKAFAGFTLYVDCDVIEADGGTRTAAISGAWVALCDAIMVLKKAERLFRWPLVHQVAAVSVGIVDDKPVVDLDYRQDSNASVDLNLVMNEDFEIIEIQGTGEKKGLSRVELDDLLDKGAVAIEKIMALQCEALGISKIDDLYDKKDFAW